MLGFGMLISVIVTQLIMAIVQFSMAVAILLGRLLGWLIVIVVQGLASRSRHPAERRQDD